MPLVVSAFAFYFCVLINSGMINSKHLFEKNGSLEMIKTHTVL